MQLKLSAENHVQSLNELESFVEVFSTMLNVSKLSLQSLLDKTENQSCARSLTIKEIGTHIRWFDNNGNMDEYRSTLSKIGIIVKCFGISVVVICGSANLAFLHKGKKMVLLSPKKGTKKRKFLIVGLGGNNTFHYVDQPDTSILLEIVKMIPEQSRIYVESALKDADDFPETVDASPYYSTEMNDVPSVSMADFIDIHTDEKETIVPEAYTSEMRVDMNKSDFRNISGKTFHLEKTLDIDGIFLLATPEELVKSLKSAISITQFNEHVDQKVISCIKKIKKDSGGEALSNVLAFKLGHISTEVPFDVFICFESDENFEKFNFKEMLQDGHNFAISFPCMASNGCSKTWSHRASQCGRPSRIEQIKESSFKWNFGKESSNCYIEHFHKHCKTALSFFRNDPIIEISFLIRQIGTKDDLCFKNLDDLLNGFYRVLDQFEAGFFYGKYKSFIDISQKWVPRIRSDTLKV